MKIIEYADLINEGLDEERKPVLNVTDKFLQFCEACDNAIEYDWNSMTTEQECFRDWGELAERGDKKAIEEFEKCKKRKKECEILHKYYEDLADKLESEFIGDDKKMMEMIEAEHKQAAADNAMNRSELIAEGRF